MNGISSTLKEELKKNSNNKNKEKLKFISAVIVTNALVAMLCLPSKERTTKGLIKPLRLLHPEHKLLVLPLTPLLSYSTDAQEIPVTLIARNKNVIIQRAYLHEEQLDQKDHENGAAKRFKIEIHESELSKSQALLEEDIVAVPYVAIKAAKKISSKGSSYEIAL